MGINQESLPSFLVFGPTGAGISTALQSFREYSLMTLCGVSPKSAEHYLTLAETDGKPVALNLALNPHEISPTQAYTLIEDLKSKFSNLKLLYLSAPTEIVLQRFSASNKTHPYDKDGIREAIEQEQLLYQALKPLSDYHIDTSTTSSSELAHKIAKLLNIPTEAFPMTVQLMSFGFKHGVPTEAEMVFDMRLPNPFYDESLRPLTGMVKPVQDYLFGFPEAHKFLADWQSLLTHILPLYQKAGKYRMTIGIGCTGGQHRSVCMTLALANYLSEVFPDFEIRINHREQSHWPKQASTEQRC